MSDYKKTRCPECGAVNGAGAPRCHACGLTLLRAGLAARPVEDDEDEPPRKPVKRPARPVEDEEEERRPAKKAKRREEAPAEEGESIRDNPILNMFFPVGVPLLAMGANYLGVISILAVLFGGALAAGAGIRILGLILPGVGAFLGLIAIIMGGLSFIIRPKKTTYGSLTGYIRAIIGMLCGLIGLIGGPIAIYMLSRM